MLIEVLQPHIDAGKRKRCTKCPIALAIMDALAIKRVKVGCPIWLGRPYMDYTPMPHNAEDFMRVFDRNLRHGVTPFSFDLDLPETQD